MIKLELVKMMEGILKNPKIMIMAISLAADVGSLNCH